MFDESTICPYSGLRSFSEEESIFFKGRDKQIDQITKLLEKNKFLMVTGASGEGKSSLVYAGMVPNARAGFFKAQYNNWQVVDFRPERTPLTNLAKTLAKKLNYDGHESVETELQRGYSALVDLYKNSAWFYDKNETSWEQKTDDDREKSKRSAANLLIIVDQFEEFFTNPENYSNNSPSEDAQVTLNILLETAKIALAENLPIYVVCTMRSDYIGQCSAFRGLPEAIGFSQFFVPRLKRNEMKLIIEEPALLNGNAISQRLTERLLYDLSEGIDQLPILQHTLNHIWHAADNGKEELDLIHYALVGGMPAAELPDEDKPRFTQWFKSLPEYQRQLYHSPGIKRVIEIHANQLYEGAYSYYKKNNTKSEITLQEAKNVVALTFACLTKIDDSRAVRNRMTLAEITGIINKPHITVEVVNNILNIFREQDNSFIRPFINDDPTSKKLAPATVLDITHESLIRNWDLLNKWANREYEYYVTFLDFKKQLNRWLASEKSKDYLLPIGPLSYFEAWADECKPNKYWIKRYRGNTENIEHVLQDSERLLLNTHEFLKKSNRKVLIARTFMKYGANRIAAVLAITTVFFLSAFYFYDAETKRNEHIIKSNLIKAEALLTSHDIQLDDKADYLLILERKTPGSLMAYIDNIEDEQFQIDIARECYDGMLFYDKKFSGPLKNQLLSFISEHISNHSLHNTANDLLLELNKLVGLMAYDYYYNNNPATLQFLKKANDEIYTSIIKSLQGGNDISAGQINLGLQFYLTFNDPAPEDIRILIDLLSPFIEDVSRSTFNTIYPQGSLEPNGRTKLDYNGGYHTLATLYAVIGDEDHLYRSLDSLALASDYFSGIPYNNAHNLIGYLYQYHHLSEVDNVISQIATLAGTSELEVVEDLLDRTGYLKYLYSSNLNNQVSESNAGYFGPNLSFLSPENVALLFANAAGRIASIQHHDERNYRLALLYKQEAVFKHKYQYDRGLEPDQEAYKKLFDAAMAHYRKVSKHYLADEINVTYTYYGGGLRERKFTRNENFIYPDYMEGYMSNTYHSPIFYHYLVEQELLPTLYTSDRELQLLNYFIGNYNEVYRYFWEITYRNDPALSDSDLEIIKSFVLSHPQGKNFDFNLLNIILANHYFKEDNTVQALALYQELKIDDYQKSAKQFEYLNEQFFLNQVNELAINLASEGMFKQASAQIETLTRPSFKALSNLFVSERLYEQNYNPVSFDYLDSAYSQIKTIKERDLRNREDYRPTQVFVLAKIGGANSKLLINEVIKSLHEIIKIGAMLPHVYGYAASDDYYMATQAMDPSLTESAELNCYANILYYDILQTESLENKAFWQGFDEFVDHGLHYKFDVRGL